MSSDTNKIEELAVALSTDPFNPKINFDLAVEYERLHQTASAVSFYLRTAEYGYETHPVLVYTSLLKVSLCMESQKDRVNTVSNAVLQAISYLPDRPEAYFLLSRFYERQGAWQECYTFASVGLNLKQQDPLPVDVEYYGKYVLEFEKAVSSWWVGRRDESVSLFKHLNSLQDIAPEYARSVKYNLERLGL